MKKFRWLNVILIILVLFTSGCDKKDEDKQEKEQSNSKLVLKENLNFEINNKNMLSDLVSSDNKVELINGNDTLDTSTLGEKEIVIKYKDNEKEKEQTIRIKVVDTTKPVIESSKDLSTKVGTKINLLKNVKATDNSLENIKVTVEGKYDFNKEGTYNLKYVAKDSSNNIAEKKFTLKVTPAAKKLGKNEYISTVDGKVHKYSFIYSDKATCEAKVQGEAPYDTVYPVKPYVVLGCEEAKNAAGKSFWGIIYYEHADDSSKFYY